MSERHPDPLVALALEIQEDTLSADPQIASFAHFMKRIHGPVQRAWNAEIQRLESTGLSQYKVFLTAHQTILVAFGSLAGGAIGEQIDAEILEDQEFLTQVIEGYVCLFRRVFVQALEHAIRREHAIEEGAT